MRITRYICIALAALAALFSQALAQSKTQQENTRKSLYGASNTLSKKDCGPILNPYRDQISRALRVVSDARSEDEQHNNILILLQAFDEFVQNFNQNLPSVTKGNKQQEEDAISVALLGPMFVAGIFNDNDFRTFGKEKKLLWMDLLHQGYLLMTSFIEWSENLRKVRLGQGDPEYKEINRRTMKEFRITLKVDLIELAKARDQEIATKAKKILRALDGK